MTTPTACPDPKVLRRLTRGQLPDAEADVVEGHLLDCPRCVAAVRRVTDESPLVGLLRYKAAVTVPQGAEVDEVVGRVRDAAAAAAALETHSHHDPDTPSEAPADEDDGLAPARDPGEIGRLGPYRVLRVIGRGGMGVVFEAEDPQLRRSVAIKVMKGSRSAPPDRREHFLREARLAAALTHDNVVPVYHVGEDGGVMFLVMPLLEGVSLAGRLAGGPRLPAAEVLRIGREAAEGLAAAHARGLIHRDVKPANLWLEGVAGRVRILDFGLAQSAQAAESLTRDGQLLGTPAYMPPEQTRGAADGRSDVYSLGVVLYQAVTGRLPFAQTDVMALLTAINLDVPPEPTDLADVPPALSDLIVRCLAKKPADRPQSARELADALRAIEQGTAPTPRRRRRWPARMAVAALIAAVGAWLCGPTVYRIATDSGELVITSHDPDVEVTVRQGGKLVEIVDLKTRQRVTLKSGKYTLELTRGADGLTLETSDFTLTRNGEATARVTLRPKAVEPPATSLELLGHDDAVTAVAVDPAGRFAASAGLDGTVRVWDLAAGAERAKVVANGKPLRTVAVSPDGKWVAAAGVGPGVFRWQVGPDLGLTPARTLGDQMTRVEAVSLTSSGRLFAAAADGTVWGWATVNGRPVFLPVPEMKTAAGVTTAALSPDGQRLLLGCRDGGFVHLWGVMSRSYQTWFEGHTDEVHAAAFVGGGRTVVTASLDLTARVWDAETGKELHRLAHPMGTRAVAADGRRVVTGCDDGKVRLWDAEKERKLVEYPGHRGKVTADGRRAVSAGDDKAVRVWTLPAAD